MEVFKNNVSLEATPTGDTHVVNKKYSDTKIKVIELTQAEYDLLSAEEKNKEVFYKITDAPDIDVDMSDRLKMVSLTQAEYDNLSTAEKNKEVIYKITNAPAYNVDATEIMRYLNYWIANGELSQPT